jgi:predicted N-acyltransferase
LYLVARNQDGVAGAIVCGRDFSLGAAADLDQLLFGRLADLFGTVGLGMLPALVCGLEVGAGEPLLVRRDLTEAAREHVGLELIRNVEDIAAAWRCSICFRGVRAGSSWIGRILVGRGYLPSREMPNAYLDLPWISFAEYRRSLRSHHPATERNISMERSRGRRSGLRFTQLEDPSQQSERLHQLMNAHYLKVGGKPFPYTPRFFEHLKTYLGERAFINIAAMGNEIVGVQVLLKAAGNVYVPMIGIDREHGKAAAVYFNLGYNRLIEDCINQGCTRIHFGRSQYELKARRGCQLLRRDLYLRTRGKLRRPAIAALLPLRSLLIDYKSKIPPARN